MWRAAQQHMPSKCDQAKQDQRHGNTDQIAVTQNTHVIRKAGYVAAPGQELAQPPQKDHHRKRHKDWMRAHICDHRPHRSASQRSDQQGQRATEYKGPDARFVHASVSPQIFAVNTIARFRPPDRIGASIARVSRPKSGI